MAVPIPYIGRVVAEIKDAWIAILRITICVIWTIFRKIFPEGERDVSSDVILITGTGHGIGRELALQYGKLGSTIICVDINEEANQRTLKDLTQQNSKAHAYTCDVSNRKEVMALALSVRKDVGFVTILVNNAGIMPCKKLRDHSSDEICKIFDINILSQFWTLEAFLPAMISNDYGHVVALSSIAGLGGYPNLVPYCSSKFAVRGLMNGLRAEMRADKRSIKFTTVYPFMTDTGLCKKPRLGFPTLLGMLKPEKVATQIIAAQRKGEREISIPFFLQFISNVQRLLPVRAKDHIDDSLKTGADPH